MVETLGQPEDKLLSDGAYTHLYFSRSQDSTAPSWRLNVRCPVSHCLINICNGATRVADREAY